MSKALNITFYIITAICWAVFVGSFIWLVVSIKTMPEPLGVHFGDDGNFDIYAGKSFAFYPFIVGAVALFMLTVFKGLSGKVSLNVDPEGCELMLAAFGVLVALFEILVSVYCFIWNYCIIKQHSFIQLPITIAIALCAVGFVAFIAAVMKIKKDHPLLMDGGNVVYVNEHLHMNETDNKDDNKEE